jgi:hypothetical protein
MPDLEEALAAMLMSGAYLAEDEARELADSILFMMEDVGDYQEHEERNPLGTTWQRFDRYRWHPQENGDVPTVASVKEGQAEMEQRLAALGITPEMTHAMTAAAVLEQLGMISEDDKTT